jgi:hypothetical protein
MAGYPSRDVIPKLTISRPLSLCVNFGESGDEWCDLTHSFCRSGKTMLPIGIICKWHNDQKAICSSRISKILSHTICSLDRFNNLIIFCDENARKFLAKIWFQNVLAAKLSFQSLDVLVVYAPPSRVKRGKTMLPTLAKLWVKLQVV